MAILDTSFRKDTIGKCEFNVGSRASSNDKWEFVPTLHLDFSDGTSRDFAFGQATLNSRGGNHVSTSYRLGE
jgi:hypothetical protein